MVKIHNLVILCASLATLLFAHLSIEAVELNNRGTNFYFNVYSKFGEPVNGPCSPSSRIFVYLGSDIPTEGRIWNSDSGWERQFSTDPERLTLVEVPGHVIPCGFGGELRGDGVLIEAEDDVFVQVMVVGTYGSTNHKDMASLRPVEAFGTHYNAITAVSCHRASAFLCNANHTGINIIAGQDDTEVEIIPTDTTIHGVPIGEPVNVSLDRGEMYVLRSLSHQVKTNIDMSGSFIKASKPVAVFSATHGADNLFTNGGTNNAFAQLLPVSSWGREYILVPLRGATGGFGCRVVAAYDNTELTINNTEIISLDAGEVWTERYFDAVYLNANNPVEVAQFSHSGTNSADSIKTVSLATVTPLEQIALTNELFPDHPGEFPHRFTFVNVLTKTEFLHDDILVDGKPINDKFVPVQVHPEFSYARISFPILRPDLVVDHHRLQARNPFAAYVYGSGDQSIDGFDVPYMYNLGGANRNLAVELDLGLDSAVVCPDSLFTLRANLRVPLDTADARWLWDFGDGTGAEGFHVQHSYAKEGEYRVSLSITKAECPVIDPSSTIIQVRAPRLQMKDVVDFGSPVLCPEALVEREIEIHNIGVRDAVIDSISMSNDMFELVEPEFPQFLLSQKQLNLRFIFTPTKTGPVETTLLVHGSPCDFELRTLLKANVEQMASPESSVDIVDFGVFEGCSEFRRDSVIQIRNQSNQVLDIIAVLSESPFSVAHERLPFYLDPDTETNFTISFQAKGQTQREDSILIVYKSGQCIDTLRIALRAVINSEGPVADAGTDRQICAGAAIQLQASGGLHYEWRPEEGLSDPTIANPIASPQTTTDYTVRVTDEKGCTDEDQVRVIVSDKLDVQTNGDQWICNGETMQLQATGGDSYQWSPSKGLSADNIPNPLANPTTTTKYTVRVSSGSCTGSTSLTINVYPRPEITVSASSIVCRGEQVELSARGGIAYSWEPAELLDDPHRADPRATIEENSVFKVRIVDENDCVFERNVSVQVADPLRLRFAAATLTEQALPGERKDLAVELESPANERIAEIGIDSLRFVLSYDSEGLAYLNGGIANGNANDGWRWTAQENSAANELIVAGTGPPMQRSGNLCIIPLTVFLHSYDTLFASINITTLEVFSSNSCFEVESSSGGIPLSPICLRNQRSLNLSTVSFLLGDAQPNPAQSSTIIPYGIGLRSQTQIVLFNSLGIKLGELVNRIHEAGNYELEVRDLPAGLYYYTMESGPYQARRKFIVIK